MPGRNPFEAFRAFMDPLEKAVACLGPAKLTLIGNGSAPNKDLAWALNGTSGMDLRGGLHLDAAMYYRIVQAEDGWKVSTLSYLYDLKLEDDPMFSIHWHPAGTSPHRYPHLHFRPQGTPSDTNKLHFRTRRLTFEDAVEWTIAMGAEPRGNWQEILEDGRKLHIEHQTWA